MRKEGFKAAAVATAAAFMLVAAPAEARIAISPVQEQVAGEGQIRNAGAAYIEEYPPLQIIQDTIIQRRRKTPAFRHGDIRRVRRICVSN